jgi:hypothetical protein
MRVITRGLLPGLIASAMLAVAVPSAQAAFGVESFFSANCKAEATLAHPCTATSTEAEHSELFTQAAGHPAIGVTDFTVKSKEIVQALPGQFAPEGNIKNIRTDVGPGESTNPEAVKKCSVPDFTGTESEPAPGIHAFTAPNCPESEIGMNVVHVVFEVAAGVFKDYELEGKMYNLEQPEGMASYFGIALDLEPVLGVPRYVHTFLEGHIEWGAEAAGTGKADYHDIYEIKNVTPGLISSRITFKGDIGTGGFLTLPSSCTGIGPQTTTTLHLETYEGESTSEGYSGPLGTEGCLGGSPFAEVPFKPSFLLGSGPGESASDQPDGITTEVIVPHDESPTGIDSSQVKTATIVLPAGMTLNPSAANGLQACTPKQIGIGTRNSMECPEASKVAAVTLNVPDLPAGSLTGSAYLGGPESGPITGGPNAETAPEYTMYVNAESKRYGVDVRLKGTVRPNPSTGRLTATFAENPEQPFSDLLLKFNGGPRAPLANPLSCGAATAEATLVPLTGTAPQSPLSGFTVDSDGKGGACAASTLALGQSTSSSNSTAGAYTSYALNLSRGDGQQYLTQVSTTLPEGLLGAIPSVTLCGETEANAGTCPANSKIGTATVKAGAGGEPYSFTGQVYMTGPYNGAPYGLSIVVPANAGPFELGNVITRATIKVNPSTTQLTVTANVPTIRRGIPFRIKNLSINVEREKFLFNPTNCGVLSTGSVFNGTPTLPPVSGASQGISTPFQVNGCSALPFKPVFSASTSAKTSKANGASLKVVVGYPAGPQANIKSVRVELPKQLPSRLTTLNKACAEAQFNANPAGCPAASDVGTATATSPVLPDKLTGPAYLVSHGSAAFPDLEIVLSADNVTVILDGQTNIKNGITSSTFSAIPDDPVSGFELNLPTGKYSVFTANGNVCAQPLAMPTVIEGQNGAKITQSTKITVSGCGVVITAHKVKSRKVKVTVVTPAAGRVSASGKYLKTVKRTLGKAGKATLTVSLSKKGIAALQRSKKGKLKVKVTVGFRPTKGSTSKASVTVTFKR